MTHRTVLITGANAGLGFETARQLAERGDWDTIVLSARSQAKADDAVQRLTASTGVPSSQFRTVLFDLALPESVDRALAQFREAGQSFDAVVLNAGGMSNVTDGTLPRTQDGLTTLFAMNVSGHARLMYGLMEANLLTRGATVIFAGSEVTRGIPAIKAQAQVLPDGDFDSAIEAVAQGDHLGQKIDPMYEYGLVKLIGTAWIRQFAHEYGDRVRALTISPGMTAGTSGLDNAPALMRFVFGYIVMPLFKLMGNAHDVSTGAARYVRGLDDQSLAAGGFYASPGQGITGPLTLQAADTQPLLDDDAFARAAGAYLKRLSAVPARNAA